MNYSYDVGLFPLHMYHSMFMKTLSVTWTQLSIHSVQYAFSTIQIFNSSFTCVYSRWSITSRIYHSILSVPACFNACQWELNYLCASASLDVLSKHFCLTNMYWISTWFRSVKLPLRGCYRVWTRCWFLGMPSPGDMAAMYRSHIHVYTVYTHM